MQLQPIFIAGCDRSGTTMLGDILGAQQECVVTPESQFAHELLLLMHQGYFKNAHEVADWLQAHFFFANWQINHDLVSLVDINDPGNTVLNLVRCYQQQTHPSKSDALYWVDHTPDNFKFYALLKTYFPTARYVHIVRDGRAVFSSIKHLKWGPNNAYMGTRHWAERIRQALLVETAEADNCIRIRYEDILADSDNAIHGLCNALNLGYDEAMLLGGGLKLPGFTKGQHKLVGKKPDASRMHSWKKKLNNKEVNDFESYFWSQVYLELFDYPLMMNTPCKTSNLRMLWSYVHDFGMYAIHRVQHKLMERKVIQGDLR